MGIENDATAIITVWGATWTIATPKATYGNLGESSLSYTTVTATMHRQPVSEATVNMEVGEKVRTTHEFYAPAGTAVSEVCKLRPAGWSAGDDEYEVKGVEDWASHHMLIRAVLVKGSSG